jgi:hypothetical protein
MRQMNGISRATTAMRRRVGHQMNRWHGPEKHVSVHLTIYFSVEVAGLCGIADECEIRTRSYPSHTSAKLLIHRLAHTLGVCLVLGLA